MKIIFKSTLVVLVLIGCGSCKKGDQTGDVVAAPNHHADRVWEGDSQVAIGKMQFDTALYARAVRAGDREEVGKMERQIGAMSEEQLLELVGTLDVVGSDSDASLLSTALNVLATLNPRLALDTLASLPMNAKKVNLGIMGIDRLMAEHPGLLLGWMRDTRIDGKKNIWSAMMIMAATLGKNKTEEALKVISAMPDVEQRVLVPTAFMNAASGSWELALKHANSLTSPEMKSAALRSVIKGAARSDLDAALLIVAQLPPSESSSCIYEIVTDRVLSKGGDIKELVGKLAPVELRKAMGIGGAVERLAKESPEVAIGIVAQIPFTVANKPLYERLAVALAEQGSGEHAVNFANALPKGAASSQIVADTFAKLASADSQAAQSALEQLNPENRNAGLRGILRSIAYSDFDASLTLAESVPLAEQPDMYREVARAAAYQNPGNAVKVLEDPVLSQKIGADFRQAMLDNTVQTWSKQDLPAAQQWVANLPATDAPMGVQGLMTTWMKTDPIAASAWLSTQPLGPARDVGARVLISQIKDTDPEMAEQWRKTLPPETGKP
jgi:hypothetical protein